MRRTRSEITLVFNVPVCFSASQVLSQSTLRTLRRNSKNLVLDSTCPSIAPHIVISPPEYQWTDMIVGQDNVAPAQSVDSLMVSAVRSPLLASVAEIEPDVTLEALPDCPSNPNSLQSVSSFPLFCAFALTTMQLETTHIESHICSDPAVSLNKSLFSKCVCFFTALTLPCISTFFAGLVSKCRGFKTRRFG